eukprot:SAG11_NODE_3388_length_2479_cov_2.572269_3_plen_200_part_00
MLPEVTGALRIILCPQVEQVVKVTGIVNGTSDFAGHGKVIDGCCDLLVDVLGPEVGNGVRTCTGSGSLSAAVSVDVVVRVRDCTAYDSLKSTNRMQCSVVKTNRINLVTLHPQIATPLWISDDLFGPKTTTLTVHGTYSHAPHHHFMNHLGMLRPRHRPRKIRAACWEPNTISIITNICAQPRSEPGGPFRPGAPRVCA